MNRPVTVVILVAISLLSQMQIALSCVNAPESPLKVGKPINTENLGPGAYVYALLNDRHTTGDWEFALFGSENAKSRGDAPLDENGMAVVLIHLGRTKEALELLKKIEKKKPGSYYVAANLGTAYELLGDNKKAYTWIAEGMKRNPDSHFGTEWLHLKILKAKQAIENDPQWMDKNSVLGIDWKLINGDLSRVQISDDRKVVHDAEAVRKAIEYQLHERTEFVKPTDPTVASLLYDLSHLVRHSRSEEHGNLVLNAAYDYGYPRPPTPSPAVAAPAAEIIAGESKTSYWIPVGISALVLGFLALAGLRLTKRHTKTIG